jgi:hypothetical protein
MEAERARTSEELEMEREKVLQLQRVEIQMQAFKKKADEYTSVS